MPATQAWPLLRNPACRTKGMTAWKSASSSTTVGDLPPSSSVTRFMVSAPVLTKCCPTADDPVNEILATSGWRAISSPTTSPRPLTTLNTPGGSPASCNALTTTCVCNALISLGLMTAVQPAASAVASLLQMKPALLFQGVIRPVTPTGVRMTLAMPTCSSKSNACNASIACAITSAG
ncbi:hypothetical protein D3C87_1597410 [compost metagenome]